MSKEKKRLEDVVLTIKHLTTGLSDALELFEMAKEEDDDASLEAVETDISSLKKEVEHLEFQRMFNQEHDEANCFLEIQPAPAEPKRRTGPACLSVCTSSLRNAKALSLRLLKKPKAMWPVSKAARSKSQATMPTAGSEPRPVFTA